MHTTKKLFVFVVVLVLIVFAVRWMKDRYGAPIYTPPVSEAPTQVPSSPLQSKVSFGFPPTLTQDTASTLPWRTNTQLPGTLLASVPVPADIQPKTNFRGAQFTIGASDDTRAVETCITPLNGERMKGTREIHDVAFTKITLTEAGAGNYYDTTSYRAVHDGVCFAIEYTIHTTNINNYDPSQGIQEFNTEAITTLLETMVQTVTFL